MNSSEMYEIYESALAEINPKVKALKSELICPIHKKRVSIKTDYCNDGTHAYISKYCCAEHAQFVAETLKEIELLDNITIE